jgi:hypothetical protein
MDTLKKVLNNLFLIILIIFLVSCSYIAYKNYKNSDESYILGYKPYIILTGSMEPEIKEGRISNC